MVSEEQIQFIRSMFPGLSGYRNNYIATVLEEYEQSKWIKFDKDDDSTWPDNNQKCLLTTQSQKKKSQSIGKFKRKTKSFAMVLGNVAHWQPLPQSKED